MPTRQKEGFLDTGIFRILVIGIFYLLFAGIIICQLWDTQIKGGAEYIKKLSKQSIRTIRVPSIRGRIFTSDGHLLADNIPSYDIYLHIAEVRKNGRTKTINYALSNLRKFFFKFDRPLETSFDKILTHMIRRPAIPMKVLGDLSEKELGIAYEIISNFPGLEIVTNYERDYPEGSIASHIIGYVRPETPPTKKDIVKKIDFTLSRLEKVDDILLTEDEQINIKKFFYFLPDLKGKNGIEAAFNDKIGMIDGIRGLSGEPGLKIVKVDNRGYSHEVLETYPEKNGNNIYLTLDWKAQEIAEKLLKDKEGAFVLVNADNGDILSMVSAPSFNLKDFYPRLSQEKWYDIRNNPKTPMVNRATAGQPPGSIIKPLTSFALLKKGVNQNEHIYCNAEAQIGNTSIKCWSYKKYGGIGEVNLTRALEQSCNKYFIENSLKHLKLVDFQNIFRMVGFGEKTGLPIGESRGLVPSRADKQRIFNGAHWNKFDMGLTSIGQGLTLITPIQAAMYVASIANGGELLEPRLLKEVRDYKGNILYKTKKKIKRELDISKSELDIVKEGMWNVVHAPTGSGKNAKNKFIELSGKTGTAQIGAKGKRTKNTWFICFGKNKGINYAACVYIYDRTDKLSGGRACAPIAKEFFEKYLKEE